MRKVPESSPAKQEAPSLLGVPVEDSGDEKLIPEQPPKKKAKGNPKAKAMAVDGVKAAKAMAVDGGKVAKAMAVAGGKAKAKAAPKCGAKKAAKAVGDAVAKGGAEQKAEKQMVTSLMHRKSSALWHKRQQLQKQPDDDALQKEVAQLEKEVAEMKAVKGANDLPKPKAKAKAKAAAATEEQQIEGTEGGNGGDADDSAAIAKAKKPLNKWQQFLANYMTANNPGAKFADAAAEWRKLTPEEKTNYNA
jgi:hypothetical protein